jgi:hypothetical protein
MTAAKTPAARATAKPLTREQVLARKTGRGKAELPDGTFVMIRALTRDEVLEMQERAGKAAQDNYAVATSLVEPVMTEGDVAEWAASAGAGDIVAVVNAAAALSGLVEGAGKSGVSGS